MPVLVDGHSSRNLSLSVPSALPLVSVACLAGQKEQEANNYLEKRYKAEPNPSLSYDDTVQLVTQPPFDHPDRTHTHGETIGCQACAVGGLSAQ